MNYLELQNLVLSDRFGEKQRIRAKEYLNSRYGRIWGERAWTFKYDIQDVAVPLGAQSIPKGDFLKPLVIWDASISGTYPKDIRSMAPDDFYDEFNTWSAYPWEFTVIGDEIIFNRAAPSSTVVKIYGELDFAPLVDNTDVPLLPSQFHAMIADGATADLLKLENDPSFAPFEQAYTAYMEDLKAAYLSDTNAYSVYPSWP